MNQQSKQAAHFDKLLRGITTNQDNGLHWTVLNENGELKNSRQLSTGEERWDMHTGLAETFARSVIWAILTALGNNIKKRMLEFVFPSLKRIWKIFIRISLKL